MLDTKTLQKYVSQIKVQNMVNADVEVVNKSPLKLMGKGRQGAVFGFTNDICVKVFGNEEDCEREYVALSLGQKSSLFPKVYAKGPLYIAMDIIRGVDVREYLQSQPLTKELSAKLIELLITFKEIGYERIDHHKRQIYIQPDGNLKVIDVARTIWRDRVYPYPRKLLTSLGEEYKALFLMHVQELAPDLYKEWQHYMEMENLSRQLYQKVLSQYQSNRKDKIKKQSKMMLTSKNEKTYATSLEGLVHKVFKEEWVKTMLALGYNPDEVMERIDAHWDQYEQKGHAEKSHQHHEQHKQHNKEQKHGKEKAEREHQKEKSKWNKVKKKEKGRAKVRMR